MSDFMKNINRNPFEGLDQLAERLGVEPASGSFFGTLVMSPSGKGYDLFALMNAFLNKMDEALKP